MAFDLVDYKTEYTKTHYDIIKAELPKGYKDKLKKLASENGMSMAAYIRCLIDEKYIDQPRLFSAGAFLQINIRKLIKNTFFIIDMGI